MRCNVFPFLFMVTLIFSSCKDRGDGERGGLETNGKRNHGVATQDQVAGNGSNGRQCKKKSDRIGKIRHNIR